MKLALLCVCVLHLALVGAGLFGRSTFQGAQGRAPAAAPAPAPAPQSTGSLSQGRDRPLFARRGQYERQSMLKPRVVPVPPKELPPSSKLTPSSVKPKCSQPTQSCLPRSGCCDPHTTCHCRFFNAICFCRRTISQHEKKT